MRKVVVSSILALVAALMMGLMGSAEAVSRIAAPKWPGHQPGEVLLGMSCGKYCDQKAGELAKPIGVHRQFAKWGDWSGVIKKVRESQGRTPWISVEGPQLGAVAGWSALAAGRYDTEIRALAGLLKANDDAPIILTFHHEPSNDGTEAQGVEWASAYSRFYDVLQAEGALVNVSVVPILGDWLFNPTNKKQEPENWVKPSVLKRSAFFGVDLYENPSGITAGPRLQRILDWMASQGYPDKMVGIGEIGGTDRLYPKKSATEFINESLAWAKANTHKIGVISYFNSTANSRTGVYWPLDESAQKTSTFRNWLSDPVFAQ